MFTNLLASLFRNQFLWTNFAFCRSTLKATTTSSSKSAPLLFKNSSSYFLQIFDAGFNLKRLLIYCMQGLGDWLKTRVVCVTWGAIFRRARTQSFHYDHLLAIIHLYSLTRWACRASCRRIRRNRSNWHARLFEFSRISWRGFLLLVPFQHGVCVMQALLHEIAGSRVILMFAGNIWRHARGHMHYDQWQVGPIFRTSMSKFVENSELARNRFKHLQNVVDCNVQNL